MGTGLASNNVSVLDSGLIVNRLSKIIGLTAREINADLSKRMERAARATPSGNERSTEDGQSIGVRGCTLWRSARSSRS